MDENKQSFEALEEAEKSKPKEEEDPEEEEEFDEVDDEGEVGEERRLSELESSIAPIEAELRGAPSETLAVPPSLQWSENDLQSDFGTSSHLLSEVPVDYTLLRPLESIEFKDQVGVSSQKALVTVAAHAAQSQRHNQLQSPGCPTSSSKLSPISVTQCISSGPSPTLLEQRPSPVANGNGVCMREVDQQNSSDPKTISSVPVVKIPSSDGYNWRKYGQKQVKSPQGSRSYYRCTYSDCYAKKIECSDHSNHVIEIICKGRHNHDPPRKINCTRESRLALSAAPIITPHPVRMHNDSDPSTSSKEPTQETPTLPETKQKNSSDSDGNTEIDVKEEHVDEPEPKRRVTKSNSAYSGSLLKPGKKPKFVVHAAGDVGISGDGYRWRKYGQKMVKGNPHPRNYYRCTSAGCPVRKHIERAVDNTSAVIITYKGIHDHDMPVPKKRQGPPSAPLLAAAAPASMNNSQFKKIESFQNQLPPTQWSVDTEGELTAAALDLGEEKAMESARTLLSIGFEIKPC
uniref:Putative WRKY transcription factor 32 isoform X2 n=1 Tax=Davidia involucrata TaxID=16924 RepID=A0A5B6YUM3_DAVIN